MSPGPQLYHSGKATMTAQTARLPGQLSFSQAMLIGKPFVTSSSLTGGSRFFNNNLYLSVFSVLQVPSASMGITNHERPRPAPQAVGPPPPGQSWLASLPSIVRAPHPESQAEPGRLTAVSLVAHVTAVIVKVAPPDAVDTVPVAAAILVTETGVLWTVGVGEGGNKTCIILTAGPQDSRFCVSISLPQITCLTW